MQNIVSDEVINEEVDSTIELKRLELQEKEKECETQVWLKELESEIAVQL